MHFFLLINELFLHASADSSPYIHFEELFSLILVDMVLLLPKL
jgi:hypothetical protein